MKMYTLKIKGIEQSYILMFKDLDIIRIKGIEEAIDLIKNVLGAVFDEEVTIGAPDAWKEYQKLNIYFESLSNSIVFERVDGKIICISGKFELNSKQNLIKFLSITQRRC